MASVCSRASSSVTVARFSRAGVAPVPSGRTGRGHGAHPARHPERRSSPPSRPRSRADRPPQGEEAGRRPETRRRRLDRGILRLAGRTRPGPVSIRPSRPEARGPAPPRCQRYGEGSARTPASHPVRSIGTPRSERLSATEPLSPGGPQPPSPHAPGPDLAPHPRDRAAFVDEKGAPFHPPVRAPVHRLLLPHAVGLGHHVIVIDQEGKIQFVLAPEFPVGCDRVGGDTEHHGVSRLETVDFVAELAGLGRAAGGVVLRIEEQHHLLPPEIDQADLWPIIRGEVERGGRIPLTQGHRRRLPLHDPHCHEHPLPPPHPIRPRSPQPRCS